VVSEDIAFGNKECIEFLEEWLKICREGKLGWVGLVGCAPGSHEMGYGFAGDSGSADVALRGLRFLFRNIAERQQARMPEEEIRIKA
jgi:hypothetical protein